MKQDRAVLLGIHCYLAKTGANFLGNCFGCVGLENSAIAAQQVQKQRVGDRHAVRKAPALDPGNALVGELTVELGNEPGLADARVADYANRSAVSVSDPPQKIVQARKFAVSADKGGSANRCDLVERGASMRNAEQAVSDDRLILAFEAEWSDRIDAGIALSQQPGCFADQHGARLGCRLKSRGHVCRVTDHRGIHRQSVADRAKDDRPGVDPNPHREVQALAIGCSTSPT